MLRYSVASSLLTSTVIYYAFSSRNREFYPSVLFLVTSKVCVACLGNQAIVLTVLFGRLVKSIFLGRLRDAEIELLYENSRYAITETCLALTIFRAQLTTRVMGLFTALLFAKVFHWLVASRVDHLEHAERVTFASHFRLASLMTGLFVLDTLALGGCAYVCYYQMPSVLLLFGFEFAVLSVALVVSMTRYIFFAIEVRYYDGEWPSKVACTFFLEFAAELARFGVYVVFFAIVFSYYGVPLHIVRELWMSFVSLRRRFSHYRRYRALTVDMDARFADATEEDLNRDRICIICREQMDHGKKLPCGHVFHLACLRLWLQQQQSCPTCRADIPLEHHVGRMAEGRRRAVDAFEQAHPPPPPEENQRQQPTEDNDDNDNNTTPQPPPPQPPVENRPPRVRLRPQQRQQQQQHRDAESAEDDALANSILASVVAQSNQFSRPQLPPGAAIYRVTRPLGIRVLAGRANDAPSRRTIPYGAHVLAVDDDDDPRFLQVGDGWIANDPSALSPFTLDDDGANSSTRHQDRENDDDEMPTTSSLFGRQGASSSSPILHALENIQNQLAELRQEVRALRAATTQDSADDDDDEDGDDEDDDDPVSGPVEESKAN